MADAFTQEAFSLLGIGTCFVFLRSISRISMGGVKGLWADDYLMAFAVIVYGLETGTAYVVGSWYKGLANNGMTDSERRQLSPDSQEYHFRVNGSKTQLIGWSLYTMLLWLLKLCMCIFFTRLTQGMDKMRWRVQIGYFVVGLTYVATVLSILLGCHPFHRNWQIFPDPGNHCQPAVSHIDLYVTVVLNVISDAYILSIPVALFWKASIPWAKKLPMIGLFSGGIFVMAAGCLRCALIIQDPIGGAQAAGSWAVRESFVALVVSNIPIVYQGYRKAIHPHIMESFRSRFDEKSGHNTRHSGPHGIDLPRLDPVHRTSFHNSWVAIPATPDETRPPTQQTQNNTTEVVPTKFA